MTPPCLLPAPYWVLSWQHNCVLEEPRAATSYYVALERSHSTNDLREISTKAEGIKLVLQSRSIRRLRRMEGITEKMNDITPFLGIHGFSSFRRKVFIHRNVFIEVLMATEIQGSNHQSFGSCSEMPRVMLLTLVFLKTFIALKLPFSWYDSYWERLWLYQKTRSYRCPWNSLTWGLCKLWVSGHRVVITTRKFSFRIISALLVISTISLAWLPSTVQV